MEGQAYSGSSSRSVQMVADIRLQLLDSAQVCNRRAVLCQVTTSL
jgi:hypothetical protein